MHSLKFLVVAIAGALAAPSIDHVSTYESAFDKSGLVRRGATYGQVCGQNRIAHCCKDVEKKKGSNGLIPIDLGRCSRIQVLSDLIHGSCNGQVCCSGNMRGLVNLQCTDVQL
ncbi:hypothetical protein GQ602_006019 [Ophiocordyceps camponoti-floridani]|uniref:Hydrophobin n=1 Tax=Ophiocordyceps camponoti-floridani TaxID=2030778 RepID=A0A8H4Q2F7_9HYPO|nr:hypothetical protein GQ602_006019 [Ophiocordyceps camponoti-floridani]